MFPKQVEPIIVPRTTKGRKKKELALQHFEKVVDKVDETLSVIESTIKLQDPTIIEMRKMLRNGLREIKEAKKFLIRYKNIQYKPKRTRNSCNTGLEKLRPISKNMALFADWEYGVTQKSRTEVTKFLCKYIKTNNLYDENNHTIILPDSKLKDLLEVEPNVILQYPTMQKYIKNCFEEEEKEEKEEEEKEEEKPKNKTKNVVKSKEKEKTEDKNTKFIKNEKENTQPKSKTTSKVAPKTKGSKAVRF